MSRYPAKRSRLIREHDGWSSDTMPDGSTIVLPAMCPVCDEPLLAGTRGVEAEAGLTHAACAAYEELDS